MMNIPKEILTIHIQHKINLCEILYHIKFLTQASLTIKAFCKTLSTSEEKN